MSRPLESRITRAFAGRKPFIAYLTAGDPNLAATRVFVHALGDAGADIIELGVPFSDPIADGPTNQRAAERALATGTTIAGILDLVAELRGDGLDTALLLFTYLNPLLSLGDGRAERIRDAGVDGILAVDLPVEEAHDHEIACREAALDRIYLAAPSTSEARLRKLASFGSGFLYYVSRYGVTGSESGLPATLRDEVERARAIVGRPVAVGFGVSTPAIAAGAAAIADGVVVGSALVRVIETHGEQAAAPLAKLAAEFARAVHNAS